MRSVSRFVDGEIRSGEPTAERCLTGVSRFLRHEYPRDMIRNVTRVVLLDVDFFREAANDATLNRQATVVVVIASGMAGVGSAIAENVPIIASILAGVIAGIVGWLLWSSVSFVVGTRAFGGDSTFAEMLRVIGFAFAPLAIGIVPYLGFPAAAWMLFASVIAVREGLEIPTPKALITMAAGWIIWLGTTVVINLVVDLRLDAMWPFY